MRRPGSKNSSPFSSGQVSKYLCPYLLPKFTKDPAQIPKRTLSNQALLSSCFPCNPGSHYSPDSDYVKVDYLDVIKTNLSVAR